MKWENTLIAYEKDIENRGFWDWLRAHTSWMKPLHRYEGILEVGEKEVIFSRKNEENENAELEIELENINRVNLGFDETFRRREDRQLGLFGLKPLRISYENEEDKKTVYLFVDFGRFPIRHCNNEEVYRELDTQMKK